MDLFFNLDLVYNLRVVVEYLNIRCNAGNIHTNIVGDLKGYGTVWYYRDAMVNILSLYRVTNNFHVKFNSRGDNKFIV